MIIVYVEMFILESKESILLFCKEMIKGETLAVNHLLFRLSEYMNPATRIHEPKAHANTQTASTDADSVLN